MSASPLWAITAFFNPQRYARLLQNYRTFRQRLNVPLVAVEIGYDGHFELGPGDADILVQLPGGDVMWQKERALNLAVGHLPSACTKAAWIDSDLVFENANWAESASRLLDEYPLVQLSSEVMDLLPDETLEEARREPFATGQGIAYLLSRGISISELKRLPEGPPQSRPMRLMRGLSGIAWAFRRDLTHFAYDASILGGGDRLTSFAALGHSEVSVADHQMMPLRRRHYLRWAEAFFAAVRGRLGFVPGLAYHCWHGELSKRRYRDRHLDMLRFDFDPETDIALDEHGLWRWNSDKPEMHAYVRDYFALRRDDG